MNIAVRPKEKLDSAGPVNVVSFLFTCARCQVLLHTQVNLEVSFYRPQKYFKITMQVTLKNTQLNI